MKRLISAIQAQIKIENARKEQRQIMLSNKSDVLFGKPLQVSDHKYLEELKQALPLLEYLSNPIENWDNIIEQGLPVPNYIQPLFNKLSAQLSLHTISGKSEFMTVVAMTKIAQEFFHEFRPPEKAQCVWEMDNKLSEDDKSEVSDGKSLVGKVLK